MFYVLFPDRARRDDVLESMRKLGVNATFHYVPLHSSDAGRAFSARPTDCPVTDDISGRLLRLPFYNNLAGDGPSTASWRRSAPSRRQACGPSRVTSPAQTPAQPGSSSMSQPDYWWFRARTDLLHVVFGPFLGNPRRTLDVGSADAPSVGWMRGSIPA